MSHFNVNLKDLLYEYKEAHGVHRLIIMSKLRTYVTDQDLLTTIDEIKTITDKKDLDILIGVGMRGALWYAVIARSAFLEGVA